jgi:hypothetical protein
MQHGFCKNQVSEKPSASIITATRICELDTTLAIIRSVRWLLVTANVVLSSPIFVNKMMEALGSPETSVLRRVTQHDIPEDVIPQGMSRLQVHNGRDVHQIWSANGNILSKL